MKKLVWLVVLVMIFSFTVFAEKPIPQSFDTTGTKIFDDLELEMEGFDNAAKFDVIIVFNEKFNEKAVKALVGAFDLNYTYQYIDAFAGTLNKGQINALSKMNMVKHIQKDAEVTVLNNDATYWAGAQAARNTYNVTGAGIGVAIIDTGISREHLDMANLVAFRDFVNNRNGIENAYDDNGHGTHCAGTAVGTGAANSNYRGVAPGASLIGVKVLDSRGSGSMSNVDKGIEWAITNKNLYNIRVISLSLGTSGSSNGNDSTSLLCDAAFDNGIVPVVAAGNSGNRRATIGSPGASRKAITVGAAVDVGEGGWQLAYFSSRGPTADGRMKPDIVAPGVNIMSAKHATTNQYVSFSGTSMATPYVAGTVALILQYNPSLTPAQVKARITSSIINNVDLGELGQDVDWGFGLLDTYKAIAGASTSPMPQPNLVTYRGYLNDKGIHNYTINVTNTTYPIAITMITTNPTFSGWLFPTINPDLDVYLYSPTGALLAKAEGTTRQESISFKPTVTGTYTVRVQSYKGAGNYSVDISYK